MAVTLEEMAKAYLNSVRQEIQKAEEAIQQNQQYLAQLQQHLQECEEKIAENENSGVQLNQSQNPLEGATSVVTENSDGSKTERIELPNPFEQLQNQ